MREIVSHVLDRAAAEHADSPALFAKRDGAWKATTWAEYRRLVRRAAKGFMALGLEPRGGVAIVGFNRPEWLVADLAAITAGGLPTGIYTTSTVDQYRYVADHCEAAALVVESPAYLDTVLAIRDRLPHLGAVVLMTGESEFDGVHRWEDLLTAGDAVPDEALEERIDAQRPDDVCTLIYTSGTTGDPKGVMLTHRNLIWTARTLADAYDFGRDDRVLSYLPLSHIAEQVISVHAPMTVGASCWFAESLEKLRDDLGEVRPTFFFAVPRVWEKMQAAIEAAGAANPALKRKIAAWARRQGLAGSRAEQFGGSRPALYGLADRLVFSKVRDKLGLDRARVCATSAAPIALATLEFFASLGIPILEVYGMSECTGPATFSYPDRYRLGYAGVAMPGTEIRVAGAGEIQMRGPHVFHGYYKNDRATREALDDEGWLHSGDIGEIDADGFLRVNDRIKELIITSGGKNIAPANLEKELRRIPGVSQAVAIGDRRNYVVALLTLDPERLPEIARAAGSEARDPEAAAACPEIRRWLGERIEEINSRLARFETIKRFTLLARDFTPDTGELTPTLKLKRRVIESRRAAEIERLYGD
jgi:long-subunit acyl-CoA synthetase (AMP-forming)